MMISEVSTNNLFIVILITLVIALITLGVILLHIFKNKKVQPNESANKLEEAIAKIGEKMEGNANRERDAMSNLGNQIISTVVANNINTTNKSSENINSQFLNFSEAQRKSLKEFGEEAINKIDKELVITKTTLEEQLKNIKVENENLKKQIQIIQENIEKNLKEMSSYNEKKINEMQNMINEKLKENIVESLEKAFQNINQNMKSLQGELIKISSVSTEVNSLRKVLSANKTAGTWGEVMLRDILNDILGSEFFEEQKMIKKDVSEKVDFAIKIPSANDQTIILPIDSKFNLGKYEEYINCDEFDKKSKREEFFKAVKTSASQIKKYISPPLTTDFAIMYIPSEGVYAEIAMNVELVREIREKYSVNIAGPNNIVAMLQSLKIGFQSLYIHKKSYEVLEALKQFSKAFDAFTSELDESSKYIQKASNKIDSVKIKRDKIAKGLLKINAIELERDNQMLQLGDEYDE